MPTLSLIRRCWWAVAVVAAVAPAPSRADAAGCGGHSGGFYTVIESDASAAAGAPAPPAPAPCRGPSCSGAPLRDGLPPAPVAPAPTEVKGQVRCLTALADVGGQLREPELQASRPVRRAVPIFHPPRHG